METQKRRRNLTNSQKINVIDKLDEGIHPIEIANQFGVSRACVYNLKGSKKKFEALATSSNAHLLQAKSFKTAKDKVLDDAIYLWFCQKRSLGEPISGPLLCEKARVLNEKLNGDRSHSFKASNGWLNNFKRRHGIQHLCVQGKRLSSDTESANTFVDEFKRFVEDNGYTKRNIYNADESGLIWRSLPRKTLVCSDKNSAPGRKVNKDRVTAMFCANALGSHKIPILIIGKYNKPRCFKNVKTLPVSYKAQSGAWMTKEIFLDWYTNEFIPLVKAEKMKTNDHGKVLLLLDNAPSHPPANVLNAIDENFSVKYLPPNVTAIIQPMDQGVIETVKKLYRKHVARRLLLDHEGRVEDFLKALTLNDCCYMISDAWEKITNSNLSKAWKVFFPHATIRINDEDAANKVTNQLQEAVIDTRLIFVQLPELNVSEKEILLWIEEDHNLPGWEPLSDETIIGMVKKNYTISSLPSKDEDQTESISRSHGACHILSAINDVSVWYGKHENCTLEDQTVLAKIRNIAEEERDMKV